MKTRTKAGLWLVYAAWVPIVVWQSSPLWGPRVLGELRYQAIMATHAVDVMGVVSAAGMFLAGVYLLVVPTMFSLRRGRR
ncbi:MAG: hypothetical protein V3T41_11790 [bacterium]